MTPKKPKHGAAANARRGSSKPTRRAAASSTPNSSKRARSAAPARAKLAGKGRRAPAFGGWRMAAVTTALAAGFFVWTYYPVAAVQYRETRETAQLASELEALKARNDRLRTQVEKLKTPAGVEDYARSQLGLVRQGEQVGVVVNGDEKLEAAEAIAPPRIDSDESTAAPAGAWTGFLDLLFGVK